MQTTESSAFVKPAHHTDQPASTTESADVGAGKQAPVGKEGSSTVHAAATETTSATSANKTATTKDADAAGKQA